MTQTVSVRGAGIPPASMVQRLTTLARYRELIGNIVNRDLQGRYKGSVLGFFWTLLNPLGMMLIFTIVFTVVMPNNQIQKFPIFFLCGFLPWAYFSSALLAGTNSVLGNANLIKKVAFPREVLPIASVLASLVNFLLALLVLFVGLLVFKSHLSPWLWMLPVIILVETGFILGMVFVLSTLNVFYRDTLMILEVVIQAWFFLTPVFYPMNMLPSSYHLLGIDLNVHRLMYIINPMASLVAAYRDLLYYGYRTDPDFFLRTMVTSLIVLAFGYWFFCRYSPRFSEEL